MPPPLARVSPDRCRLSRPSVRPFRPLLCSRLYQPESAAAHPCQAIAFFGGYSFFSATLTPSHLICHTFGGGLIALLNLTKSHYAWIWYLFVFFSCIPTLFDVAAIGTACLRPGKRW
jgi:hypothetical protein